VLSIKTELGTWVINQYAVTKQIWVSSPLSGPSKYNWNRDKPQMRGQGEKGVWASERDDTRELQQLLEKEFSQVFGVPITFDEAF
jgi:frataxin